mgnify:CR=1 FL=1
MDENLAGNGDGGEWNLAENIVNNGGKLFKKR